ncbi:MAG: histidinol-phosphate transaminase [Cytophagales bacterium]|jgi:histidinol-phosphate aminotransferase|nr:histidinol-phosphate transaminase [Cytophagales bacterium]MCE2958172.1 histidinol-phosphate transaminase [Flammeovirgaceae bacterium]MCZ8069998.1 histidinol-phosphate transaminase [Cytophagales bacterium]
MQNMNLDTLVRQNVRDLKPYSSARDDFQGVAQVYLDANENPNPSAYNRYPDPLQRELKKRIGLIKGVDPKNIFLGNGSDEPIDLLFRAFCEPGIDNVVIPQPTYGMYAVSANINNVKIKSSLLTEDFDLDVNAILTTIDSNSKLLFLCSPNNPSGNLLSRQKVIDLLKVFSGLVILDEAYIDFAGTESYATMLQEYHNLVVLQTLSKAWGLAAIRLGMCFAHEGVIDILNKIKPPYNISILTQQVALAQLDHEPRKNQWVTEIVRERNQISAALAALPVVLHVLPSDANFLLVKVRNAKEVYQKLIRAGIVVRDRSSVILCDDCLRITIGTPEENQKLLSALNAINGL